MDPNIIINNIPETILFILFSFYVIFRILGKFEQKKYGLDNFEWWAYRGLLDMYKNQGYPYPKDEALMELKKIIDKYKVKDEK